MAFSQVNSVIAAKYSFSKLFDILLENKCLRNNIEVSIMLEKKIMKDIKC
jgi:hypothetical protein